MKNSKPIFWLLLLFSQCLHAQAWEFPSASLPPATDFKTCKQKIRAGLMPAKMVLNSDTLHVLQTDTLPENLTLEFLAGKLKVAQNQTLYIEGQVLAGRWAIFSGSGKIVFLRKSTSVPIPQWWGAKADLIQDDQPALQKWIDAMGISNEALVAGFLPAGKYLVKSPVLFNKVRLQIKGAGRMLSVIVAGDSILAPAIAMANEMRISLISFNANYRAKHAFWVANAANSVFEDAICSSALLDGVYISAKQYGIDTHAYNDRIYWNNWDSSGNGAAYFSSTNIPFDSLKSSNLDGASGCCRAVELGGKITYNHVTKRLIASKGASFRPKNANAQLYPSQPRAGDIVRLKFELSNNPSAKNSVYMPSLMWATTNEKRVKLIDSLGKFKLNIGDRIITKNMNWRVDKVVNSSAQEKWLISEWPQFSYTGYLKTKAGKTLPAGQFFTMKTSTFQNELSMDATTLKLYRGKVNLEDTLILENQYRLVIAKAMQQSDDRISLKAPFVHTYKSNSFHIELERNFMIKEILNDSTASVYGQFELPYSIPSAEYVIGIGDGVRETYGSDNNINLWHNGFYIGNGGNGRSFNGFYGPYIVGGQTDLNTGYGLVLGGFASNMLGAEVHSYYLEGNLAGNILLGGVQGCFIGQGVAGSPKPTLELPDPNSADFVFMGSLMKEEAISISDYRKGIDFSGLLLRKTEQKTLLTDEFYGYGYPLFMDTMYFEVELDPWKTTSVNIEIKTKLFETLEGLHEKGLKGVLSIPELNIFPERTLVYEPLTGVRNVSISINSTTTTEISNRTVFKANVTINNNCAFRQKIKVYPRIQ